MANKENKKVLITDTILRDAHQSQAATRMRLDEMLPVLEQLDDIGYYSLEAWGGATFDTCLRFLNEDPWERLRTLRKYLKKTPIQMLLRGQNLLGYRHSLNPSKTASKSSACSMRSTIPATWKRP